MFIKIQPLFLLLSLAICSFGQSGKKSYPEADAVYLNLTKTYSLNKDGSMVNTVEKRQKLLTYRAFQSLFGETRITYNPQFQKVAVTKAFTENTQREKIETPENGYNDIQPAFANNSKAFSHLREMVVTHTGLERGATINCNYEIKTAAGKFPGLMGNEELQTDCPVEKLTIIVKVPTGKPLYYKLLNGNALPKIEKGKEFDSYTWQLSELPQRSREILSSVCNDLPRLLFSTQNDNSSVVKWLADQEAFRLPVGEEAKKYIDQKISGENNPTAKALKIQEIVVKELNSLAVPAQLLAFQVRTPEQVWQSNSGTTLEKCVLLTALLKAEGLNAEVCMIVPACYNEERSPFLLAAEPVIKMTTDQGGFLLLSADRQNAGNFDVCSPQKVILALGAGNKKYHLSNSAGKIEVKGALVLGSDGKLTGELSGSFANSCNPYFEIVRNSGVAPRLMAGLPGKAEKFTAGQAEVKFKVEKADGATTRGNFKFVDLFESEVGISSFHLNPLPFKRTTTLDLGSPLSESYNYTVNVPDGYKLANPIELVLVKPNAGKLTIRIQQQDKVIAVTRSLELSKAIVTKEKYAEFKELLDKWFTAKYRQLILKAE
jgi:hypothetical protein